MIDGVNQFWEICIFAIWRARRAARLGVRAVRGLSFLTPPEKGQMFPLAESFSSVLKSGAEAEAIAQDNLDGVIVIASTAMAASTSPLLSPSGFVGRRRRRLRRSSGHWPLAPARLLSPSVRPFLPLILLSTAVYVRRLTTDATCRSRAGSENCAKRNEYRFKMICKRDAPSSVTVMGVNRATFFL